MAESKSLIILSYDLQNPQTLEYYRAHGFQWIRRVEEKDYNLIMRQPTIGCVVELTTYKDTRSAHIDTINAKRLIKSLNYFTNYMYI
jgi:hypothetical protein